MALEAINIHVWLDENKHSFLPPVCNKLMHGAGQLKIMFIGGPNQRKDYHIEEGEEFFIMLKGDMVLKVIEKGEHRDIPIKQGEVFLLPSRIPHSPQRFENTIGLVIERERLPEETDGLRYYVDGTTDTLWEEWFHCNDLGSELGPLIKKYFASEEHRTGKPPQGKVFDPPPVNIDTSTATMQPFSFKQWLETNTEEIKQGGKKLLFGNGEFKFWVRGEGVEEDQFPGEVFLWQLEGEAEVSTERGTARMGPSDSILIHAGERFSVRRQPKSIGITVTTDPLANKSH